MILHLRSPNLGPNSGKLKYFDARTLDTNSWVGFSDSVVFQEKRPPEKITLERCTSQNSPQKSGQKTHIGPLQGHLADETGNLRTPFLGRPLLDPLIWERPEERPYSSWGGGVATSSGFGSSGIKRDKLNGTNGPKFAVFRRFSLIFADFRFSWELQHFGGADFRRKPQETADFRRKPQKPADFRRNPFVPFSLSLLVPPYWSSLKDEAAATEVREAGLLEEMLALVKGHSGDQHWVSSLEVAKQFLREFRADDGIRKVSQGEKPPKIRKKSSQEQSSWELLDLLPLKRQRKQAKSREHWSEKFLGTSVPRNLFFFLGRFFCPLLTQKNLRAHNHRTATPPPWARENGAICPFGVFSLLYSDLGEVCGQSM